MREKETVMKKLSIGQMNQFGTFTDESLFICEFERDDSSYVQLPLTNMRNVPPVSGFVFGEHRVRPVVRRGLAGSVSTGPVAGSRLTLHGRVALAAVAIAVLATGCSEGVFNSLCEVIELS
jgi:hypothetical protein